MLIHIVNNKLEKLVSDPYLLYLANKNMLKLILFLLRLLITPLAPSNLSLFNYSSYGLNEAPNKSFLTCNLNVM